MSSADMRRDFKNRDELIDYLQQSFATLIGNDDIVSDIRGGRVAAEARLNQIQPDKSYANTRNYVDGAVSRLSPYIRYGVLSLAEIRDRALEIANSPDEVEKFINELSARDYYQRKYVELGDMIWEDQEPYKTGFAPHEYADQLPTDIEAGTTGVTFIDDIVHELVQTGYLHNHARMWFAAYVVHWRRVKWQAGARFFLSHLLDGDPASNHLSWQWVASTFSNKPYYYNIDNVIKYTGNRYRGDPYKLGHQDFVGSYEQLARKLFPRLEVTS